MRKKYKLNSSIQGYILNELYQYYDNKERIEEMKLDNIEESPPPPDGQPKGNGVGNPTEQKAVRNMTTRRIMTLERNVKDIDNVRERLDEYEREIFDLIFKKKMNWRQAETEKNLMKDSYYNIKNKIVYLTAIEFGEI